MTFRKNRGRRVQATLDMTPMIDVVFQLIIFFMLSSTFVIQSSVPIELSKVDEGAVQPEKKQLTITLSTEPGGPDNEGMVYLDDTPVGNWIDLRRALMELKNRDPEALVLIRPDKNIITERLLKVMGMAHACGILHYGVAAEQPVSADITAPLPADGAAPAPPAAEPAPAAAPAPAAGGK